MSASFFMSGLVTLGESHGEFFTLLGLPAPPVLTVEQFHVLLSEARGVLSVMSSDPDADPVVEFLSSQILADIVQQFAGAVGRLA